MLMTEKMGQQKMYQQYKIDRVARPIYDLFICQNIY